MIYKTQKTKQDLKESEEALQYVMANINATSAQAQSLK